MTTNEEEHQDPAGSTGKFQRFVEDNAQRDTAPEPGRSMLPYVLVGIGVLVVAVIIVLVAT